MAKILRKIEISTKKITRIANRNSSNTNRVNKLPSYMRKEKKG